MLIKKLSVFIFQNCIKYRIHNFQIPRGEGWAYARSSRYHFEHVIGHYIGSIWMKYFSWEYCGEDPTNVRLEMMVLTSATLGLLVHILQLDSALKMQDNKSKD